jgi:hypothetical protein
VTTALDDREQFLARRGTIAPASSKSGGARHGHCRAWAGDGHASAAAGLAVGDRWGRCAAAVATLTSHHLTDAGAHAALLCWMR